eukprot:5314227-Amphidinium_carterae.1
MGCKDLGKRLGKTLEDFDWNVYAASPLTTPDTPVYVEMSIMNAKDTIMSESIPKAYTRTNVIEKESGFVP